MKRKHYDCIVAWANGEKIEYKNTDGLWVDVIGPPFWAEYDEYRIKKEPMIEVKYFVKDDAYNTHHYVETIHQASRHGYYDLKITYQDGKAIKAEVADLYFIDKRAGAMKLNNSEANARRIVACVNACAGIPTTRLENGAADILTFSMELHKQRDELLAAAKNLRDVRGRYNTEIAMKRLIEIIAKVESEK